MRKWRNNRLFKGFSTVMAGIVVFVTTYSLILPAISIEYNIAQSMPGLDVADIQQTEDMSASDELSALQSDDSSGLLYEGSGEAFQDPEYRTGELELTGSSIDNGIEGYLGYEDYKDIDGYGDGEGYGYTENYTDTEEYSSVEDSAAAEIYADADGLYVDNEGLATEETSDEITSTSELLLPETADDPSYDSYETDNANGEVIADTNSLTAELEGVKLHLDFDEAMPGGSELSLREIDEEYYDNYFTSAGYELEKAFPDYEMSDAHFLFR